MIGVSGVHVEGAQLLNAALTSNKMLVSTVGDNSKSVTAFVWTTGRVERYTRISFSLTLTSETPLAKDRWSEIVKNIHVEAQIQ